MRARDRRISSLAVGLAAMLALGATQMAAAAAPAPTAARPTSRVVATRRQLAGYLRNTTGPVSVHAAFRVPDVVCPPQDVITATAPGVAIYTDDGMSSSVTVDLLCVRGTEISRGDITYDGLETPLYRTIVPGDWISVTLSDRGGFARATIKDPAQHWSYFSKTSIHAATEVGIGSVGLLCAGDGCEPELQFAPVKFRAATIDAGTIADAAPSRIRAADGSTQAKAGARNPADDGFTVTWVSTCSPVDANGRC